MKKNASIDVPRLCTAIQRSRLVLRRYREERRDMVRQYVGNHWSEEGADRPVPVNLISLYVSVVARSLIAKDPRVMLATARRENRPTISAMEAWANKEVKQMCLAGTLQRVVVDALFSIGVCKVALATPAESASVAWSLQAGQPFAERVDLDDFVFDNHARAFEEVGFIGHRYRAPLDVVKNSPVYGKGRKDLTASTDPLFNQEGDERINVLGRSTYGDQEEWEDMVDLWEVYLPRHRLILTLADEQLVGPNNEPLRVQRWLGPDTGPYHILSMMTVPGNCMPKAPIQDLMDLHMGTNRAYRKVMRGVDRMKEVTAVRSGKTEDGERIIRADDGDAIRVDDPDNVKQIVFGGQHIQQVLAMATIQKDLFAYMAGNLDMMGGLSPQSKTLGQDRLLEQNASRAVADMQDRTTTFTAGVLEALCWYWWHDPFKVMKSKYSLPGSPEISIGRQVTPEMRKQRFEELDIEVDPYSMQHSTPQTRLQAINQVVQTIVIPMMQLLQSQGISFDVNAYLQKVAKLTDIPDLADIITVQEPPQPPEGGGAPGGDKPPMPAQTERKYVRENMPGRTRQGNDMNLVNSMLGISTGGGVNKNGVPNG